ncbi:hypothetical protein F4604DRAFT_1687106 [Suillus subluteus]|nr:hypothetical protein F4604DRAFT_1687106 [Suillus subluteus]
MAVSVNMTLRTETFFHAGNETLFRMVSNIGSEDWVHSMNSPISTYHLYTLLAGFNQGLLSSFSKAVKLCCWEVAKQNGSMHLWTTYVVLDWWSSIMQIFFILKFEIVLDWCCKSTTKVKHIDAEVLEAILPFLAAGILVNSRPVKCQQCITFKKIAQEDETYTQGLRKTQKYATQGLRQRQALKEVNDFTPLDLESEDAEDDGDIANGNDDEPLTTDSLPERLWDMQTKKTVSIPSAYLNTPVVPWVQLQQVIDPQLLTGNLEEEAGPRMESSRNESSSKYVQQTRFECRFAMAGPHSSQVAHDTPTPFRGVPLSLKGEGSSSSVEPMVAQQPVELMAALGAVKCPDLPLTEVEGLQVVQKVKIGDGGSCGRIQLGHYHTILANSTIYPGDVESCNWSGKAWAALCQANGVRIDYDEDTYKLITSQGSNLQSNLKTVMWPLVMTEFGFSDDKTPEATSLNAVLVKSLLENCKNFIYKDRKEGKGVFEAEIIQKGIIKWCYKKKNSLGVKFPAYFMDVSTDGMSFGIIVAILTAVDACVMEWTTRTRTETKFYKEQYATVRNMLALTQGFAKSC